jgi:hypothetical protein
MSMKLGKKEEQARRERGVALEKKKNIISAA